MLGKKMLSSLPKWDDKSIVGTNKGISTLQDKGHRCQCRHKSYIRINVCYQKFKHKVTHTLNEKHCSLRL